METPHNPVEAAAPRDNTWFETRLPERLRDYAQIGVSLFWQRMLIYTAGLTIGAVYIDPWVALLIAALFAVSEAFDLYTFHRILRTPVTNLVASQRNRTLVVIGATANSAIICLAVLWIAAIEGPGEHFMPYFILLAASLFGAMNSHQLPTLVKIKLVCYGTTFLFIPAWDIVETSASISTSAWMRLFTNAFFLYFMVQCARIFLRLYRRQIEQIDDLRDQHEKVETAYRLKSEFLSTMSHELRTPMTSINGAVMLARSGKLGELPPRVDSILEIAETNCKRLSALINDVLDLQKIEEGKLSLHPETIELGTFLKDTVKANSPYGSQFQVSFQPDLPLVPVHTEADRGRLEQVMANLLSNAAKFSYPGDTVTVRLEADDKTARILVIDTGIGLSEKDRDQVFDKFSQVDASDKRKTGGTGLGMNISKRILEEQGATIDYRKNTGPGTTFIVEMKRMGGGGTPDTPFPGQSPGKPAPGGSLPRAA